MQLTLEIPAVVGGAFGLAAWPAIVRVSGAVGRKVGQLEEAVRMLTEEVRELRADLRADRALR